VIVSHPVDREANESANQVDDFNGLKYSPYSET